MTSKELRKIIEDSEIIFREEKRENTSPLFIYRWNKNRWICFTENKDLSVDGITFLTNGVELRLYAEDMESIELRHDLIYVKLIGGSVIDVEPRKKW